MTNRDLVAGVFVEEWAELASSPVMRRALRRWRETSNGIITATTHDELLAIIKDSSRSATSMEVATWLMATADPMAIRILVQATQPIVMVSIRKAELLRDDLAEYANSCVAALFLAVSTIAGTTNKWVIMSIRRAYLAEVGLPPGGSERSKIQIGERPEERDVLLSRLDGDREIDPRSTASDSRAADVKFAQLLIDAVHAGKVSLCDAQMLWLHTIGGVSYAELSAERGMKIANIRKRHARAVRRISFYAESMAA